MKNREFILIIVTIFIFITIYCVTQQISYRREDRRLTGNNRCIRFIIKPRFIVHSIGTDLYQLHSLRLFFHLPLSLLIFNTTISSIIACGSTSRQFKHLVIKPHTVQKYSISPKCYSLTFMKAFQI